MAPVAVTFDEVVLAVHIMAVVVAFGVLFAEPLFMLVGARLEPSVMPWFHHMQQAVGRRIVNPGLLLVVICGVILASELHAWQAFYVQWGIGAALVIGALEGMVVIPRVGRLADVARRDVEGRGGLSSEYRSLARQTLLATSAISLLVLVTIFLMVIRTGA